MKKMKQGFTLIELLIVIVIIGILAVIVISVAGNSTDRANDAEGKANIHSAQTALEMYHVDNNAYPDTFTAADGMTTDYVKADLITTVGEAAYSYTTPVAGCYLLSYDVANENDPQAVDDGSGNMVFEVTCNQ